LAEFNTPPNCIAVTRSIFEACNDVCHVPLFP
jgi:hypothetical protein